MSTHEAASRGSLLASAEPGTRPAASSEQRGAARFALYVFDLDGTLIDSRRDLADSVNAVLVERGLPALDEAHVGRMVGDGAAALVARAFSAYRMPPPANALERFLALYADRLTAHTVAYQGIPETLAAIGRRATMAVLTNKPLAPTRTILRRLDLARFFPAALVVGGDGPFARKPDPAGLRELMRATGTPPSATVLIGDSRIDVLTARAAGSRICVARYGFGFEGFSADPLTEGDFSIDAPAGILNL